MKSVQIRWPSIGITIGMVYSNPITSIGLDNRSAHEQNLVMMDNIMPPWMENCDEF